MAKLFLGLSGYSYKEWRGESLLYPPKLKEAEFLKFYGSRFNSVEADGTWYHLPTEATVAKWIAETSEGFSVSPKMHREVTHFKRLKPGGFEIQRAFVERLKPVIQAGRLGAVLVQLPPNLKRDDELLVAYLEELRNLPRVRWSILFREESWQAPEVDEILRHFGVATVAEEDDEHEAYLRDTAEHRYVRLRRREYTRDELEKWAGYFKKALADGKDCYVYCKHKDAKAPWLWADQIFEFMKAQTPSP